MFLLTVVISLLYKCTPAELVETVRASAAVVELSHAMEGEEVNLYLETNDIQKAWHGCERTGASALDQRLQVVREQHTLTGPGTSHVGTSGLPPLAKTGPQTLEFLGDMWVSIHGQDRGRWGFKPCRADSYSSVDNLNATDMLKNEDFINRAEREHTRKGTMHPPSEQWHPTDLVVLDNTGLNRIIHIVNVHSKLCPHAVSIGATR